jgi:hypothetical protein
MYDMREREREREKERKRRERERVEREREIFFSHMIFMLCRISRVTI